MPIMDMAFLPSFVSQQEIQCKRIHTIPEIPSDVMPLSFHFAIGHFNTELIGIGIDNYLLPFVRNDRFGSALIESAPDIDSLCCRVHTHLRIG